MNKYKWVVEANNLGGYNWSKETFEFATPEDAVKFIEAFMAHRIAKEDEDKKPIVRLCAELIESEEEDD